MTKRHPENHSDSAAADRGSDSATADRVTDGAAADRGSERSRYLRPADSQKLFNGPMALLTKLGLSMWGSRVLYVRGRKTGEWRSTPVNLMTFEGQRYLVAPRGHTQWVRNLRVSGEGRLRIGRRTRDFTATEVADEAKPELLRAYLKRWKFEVGAFFDGVDAKAPDSVLLEIAPGYPVFRINGG